MTLVFVSLDSPVLPGKVPKFKPELKLLIPGEQLQREINSDRCPAVEKASQKKNLDIVRNQPVPVTNCAFSSVNAL